MKILFCCDGSRQAEAAVRFGVLMVSACGAEPSILGIAENPQDEHALRKGTPARAGHFYTTQPGSGVDHQDGPTG